VAEERRSGWVGSGAVALATAALYLGGGLEWAERHLMDLRFALDRREPAGHVVLVAIDPKSLSSLESWPWPRGYHATVLENLLALGATQVAFDVDFSSSSIPEEDAALEQAVGAAGRRVLLPVFRQSQLDPSGGQRLVETRPLPALAASAALASINIQPDADGLVRRYGAARIAGSTMPPGMAERLAGRSGAGPLPDGPFYLDFGIDVASIPVVSYADVLTGVAPPAAVAGKAVIVGATALELGDQAPVPLLGAIPGPLLQALAFESLDTGRALSRSSTWMVLCIVLVSALGLGSLMQRLSWRGGLVLLAAGWGVLFLGAAMAQRLAPMLVDIAPGGAALGGCFCLALIRRINQQELKAWLASLRARQVELRMRHVVQNCSEAIVTLDREGRIETLNRAAESLFGRPASDTLGRSFTELLPDTVPLESWMEGPPDLAVGESTVVRQRATMTRPDSQTRSLDMAMSTFNPDGRAVQVVFLQDVTERVTQQERLRHQATHDALTGLPNRMLIFERMRHSLGGSAGAPRRAALLMLDLDRFKEINDTLGHATGDRMLCRIAGRLGETLEAGGVLARLGGDEFAVLLPGAGRQHAESAARRLLEALTRPFELEGMSLQVEASVGVALCPDDGDEPGLLLQRADVAMYVAKRRRASVCFYNQEVDANSLRHLALHGELREAIQNDTLELHYQPKIDLQTEGLVGAEGLLRWNHPTYGMLPPVEFIPLAERTGLIKPLTHWVVRTALTQAAAWAREGMTLPLSVNCSVRNLLEEDLPTTIGDLLRETRVPAARLVLEITETAIIEDPARSLRVLKELAALGVKISIDDFGTAYSSLDYLRKLPATELKIDRSFVAGIDRDASDATIVRATVRLAQDFGLQAVAEGIESRAVMDRLRAFGCHQGQGHFISPPLPPRQFVAWNLGRSQDAQVTAFVKG